jgi:phosphopantetheinyl transferase
MALTSAHLELSLSVVFLVGRMPEPPLAEGFVDVWRADLSAGGKMRARGVLRVLLARYLACDPGELCFKDGPHGKPALSGFKEVCFNLSHSGDLALFAFTLGAPVGVDVELIDRRTRRVDDVALARRVFGREQARRLAALDQAARRWEFLRAWVRYEAVLKCHGSGLLAQVGSGLAAADAKLDRPQPSVIELDLGPVALAAVAVQGACRQVRLHHWSSPWETQRSAQEV